MSLGPDVSNTMLKTLLGDVMLTTMVLGILYTLAGLSAVTATAGVLVVYVRLAQNLSKRP